MKACIYQRQVLAGRHPAGRDPHLEGRAGKVLGFEIYGLLDLGGTRLNLCAGRRLSKAGARWYKVLAAGRGGAGSTLAHHLINDGHLRRGDRRAEDVGAAGYREISAYQLGDYARAVWSRSATSRASRKTLGARTSGRVRRVRRRHYRALGQEFPEDRGLLLNGAQQFAMYGRGDFGGTVTIDNAFAPGLRPAWLRCALGAGRPTVIPMANGLALGVRQASDFLMALQLTGAAKTDSIANLTGAAAGRGDRRQGPLHSRSTPASRRFCLLPVAGREVSRALMKFLAAERAPPGARRLERSRRARSPTNSSPMPVRSAPSVRLHSTKAVRPASPN